MKLKKKYLMNLILTSSMDLKSISMKTRLQYYCKVFNIDWDAKFSF